MIDTSAPPMPSPARARRGKTSARAEAAAPDVGAAAADTPAAPVVHPAERTDTRIAALLLAASGASALVFQVLWVKQLSLVVGVEVHAIAIAISAFFGGLALGGFWFGRQADHLAHTWRGYARLEAAVAVSAVLATLLLARAAPWFAWADSHLGVLAWALPCVLVGLPAVFMGGTLPMLMRACQPDDERDAGGIGALLYAANTLGGVVGVLAVPFALIPWLGVQGSALAAAALNGLLVLIALWRQRVVGPLTAPADAAPHTDAVDDASTHIARPRLALALYGIAGGVALGYEVLWSQAIVQFVSTRTFAFAIVLATYLLGLTLGSAMVRRRVRTSRHVWATFAALIGGAAALTALTAFGLGDWLLAAQAEAARWLFAMTDSPTAAMSARFAMAAACLVLLPTMLLGAAFPYALRMATDGTRIGRDTGRLLAVNTAGGIAGTLLTGFWLVPVLGLVRALGVLAGVAAAVALFAVFASVRRRTPGRAMAAVAVALAVIAVGASLATPRDRFATMLADARGGRIAFYEEAQGATVTVLRQSSGSHTFNRLYIQGVSNSGDTMTSLRYMRLQALLPLLIASQTPRSALVIGLGTGITAGALLQYPGLTTRETAELLPAVVRATSQFSGNYGVASDPRMRIRIADGRRALYQDGPTWDLITLEPPPPSAAGVTNLYSTDFYRLAASRLTHGGMVAQWLPLPTQNEAETKALIASFVAVFPHASLWTTELHEMLMVGSMQPMTLDAATLTRRFEQPGVREALREVGIASPGALLATWITDRSGMAWYAEDAAPVTDDRPRIEYAPWVQATALNDTLSHLLAMQSDPPVVNADAAMLADMRRSRDALRAFYGASLAAMSGNRNGWRQQLDVALALDGGNPYFAWFVGRPKAGAAAAP